MTEVKFCYVENNSFDSCDMSSERILERDREKGERERRERERKGERE